MELDNENKLNPYTKEQMERRDVMPEKTSSISHDVEVVEESRIEHTISQIKLTSMEVSKQTNERFCFLGSMAMYAYLHEMTGDATKLQILEARIAGGKNDIDLAVPRGEIKSLTDDFGWGEEEVSLGRGHVGESHQIIDVMERQELPSFNWQEVAIDGETMLLEHPVEMIFEKMIALQENEDGEIKWGVDIKILKTYLMSKNDLDEVGVEEYLAEQFDIYKNEVNYDLNETNNEILNNIQSELQVGKSKEAVISELLEKKSGQPVENLKDALRDIFGESLDYDNLMVQDNEGFILQLNSLISRRGGMSYDYQDLAELSQNKYSELLTNK